MSQANLTNINWDEPIPVDRPRYIPILSPKPGVPCSALVVCSKLVKVATHFIGNRTRPHLTPASECDGCKAQLSTRWKGYVGAWHQGFSRYVLVELTHQAAEDNHALLGDPNHDLRGMEVVLHRQGKNRNAPVKGEFRPCRIAKDKIPAPFDVRLALLRIWERQPNDRKDELPDQVDQVDES